MRRPPFHEFIAPAPLVAVAVMALNDHWLKAAFHNALTGKLSDLAICFFLPLYVAALLGVVVPGWVRGRLVAGAVIATAAFVGLELSDAAGALYLRFGAWLGAGGGRLTRDATDLLALVMVPVAVAYGTWRVAPPEEVST